MATASAAERHAQLARQRTEDHESGWRARIQPALDFWQKVSNDWVFNMAAMIAYNMLMSIFPLLLVLIAIAGFIVGTISPASRAQLISSLADALPGGASGAGGAIVTGVANNLTKTAGVSLIVGLVTAIYSGSRLFTLLESAFSVVFRLRARNFIRQNIMAIGMLLLYAILVPVIFLASILPAAVLNAIGPLPGGSAVTGFLVQAAGVVVALLAAFLLFGAIYVVVPNRKVHWNEVWKGTLVASVLLLVYELVFPIYQSLLLKPSNYASIGAFAIIILVFFYYFGFIVLLGAEVNSYASGQRATAGDIPAVFHEVQAHNTTRGAAGVTAGTAREDLQHHKGAAAMRTPATAVEHEHEDHKGDVQPPEFAEAGVKGHGPEEAQPETKQGWQTLRQAEREATGKDDRDHDGPDGHDQGADRQRDREQSQEQSQEQSRQGSGQREASRRGELVAASSSGAPHGTARERHAAWQARPDAEERKGKTLSSLAVAAGAAIASAFLLLRRRSEA